METTQLLKGVLYAAVLAIVQQADGYGYDVVRRLREAGLEEVGDASVYGTLRRLYAAGALSTRSPTPPPPRAACTPPGGGGRGRPPPAPPTGWSR